MRLRNPWGRKEWEGAWGDEDHSRWNSLSSSDKEKFEIRRSTGDDNGEFYMDIRDFSALFNGLDVVHIKPDSMIEDIGTTQRFHWENKWEGETAAGRPIGRDWGEPHSFASSH